MSKTFLKAFLILMSIAVVASAAPLPSDQRVVPLQNANDSLQQLVQRLMQLSDISKLDQALAQLVGASRITREQASRIRLQWQSLNARKNVVGTAAQPARPAARQAGAGARSDRENARLLGENQIGNPIGRPPAMPAEVKQLWQIKDPALLAQALAKLVADGKISQDQAARIQTQWQAMQAKSKELEELRQVMNMNTEAELTQALLKLVAEGKLTNAQAEKARLQWLARQVNRAAEEAIRRVLQIDDPVQFESALKQLAADGKITALQADKIRLQWKARQAAREEAEAIRRLWKIDNEPQLVAALGQMVAAGKLTQQQADKIKARWTEMTATKTLHQQLLAIETAAKFEEALAAAEKEGKLTPVQVDRIRMAWQKIHK